MPPGARGLAALWYARPVLYSRRAWLCMLALDPLPWPWGEEILAKLFVAKAFARPRRLRQALAWAAAQPPTGRGRWQLALSTCAHQGRFLARQALLGIRTPDEFRRHIALEGKEHLAAASSGAILLGFHLGPPGAAVALRAIGHRVTWVDGPRASRTLHREAWRRFPRPGGVLTRSTGPGSRGAMLYRARRLLLDGATIYIAAEGGPGREAFRVALPGGSARIRSGWFVLRRQCDVPVLPVLAHLESLTQVIVVHPPLPPPIDDPARDLEACRDALAALLDRYVRTFPEQCYGLAFP